jgi:hypothetical protein
LRSCGRSGYGVLEDADALLLNRFPSVIQLHGLAVFIDRIRVIVQHPGIFRSRADGVVERRGEEANWDT